MNLPLPKKIESTSFVAPGNKMQHTIFEVILLIVVAVLFYMFLLQPKRVQLATVQDQLATLNKQKVEVQENKKMLNKLLDDLHSHPQQIAELDEALPLDGRITRYRIAIENLVGSAGMKVGDVSVEYLNDAMVAGDKATLANPYAKTRKLQKFSTTITVAGTFQQFTSLLEKLENSGRIIDVTGLSITSSKKDAVDFRLTTQSYFYE